MFEQKVTQQVELEVDAAKLKYSQMAITRLLQAIKRYKTCNLRAVFLFMPTYDRKGSLKRREENILARMNSFQERLQRSTTSNSSEDDPIKVEMDKLRSELYTEKSKVENIKNDYSKQCKETDELLRSKTLEVETLRSELVKLKDGLQKDASSLGDTIQNYEKQIQILTKLSKKTDYEERKKLREERRVLLNEQLQNKIQQSKDSNRFSVLSIEDEYEEAGDLLTEEENKGYILGETELLKQLKAEQEASGYNKTIVRNNAQEKLYSKDKEMYWKHMFKKKALSMCGKSKKVKVTADIDKILKDDSKTLPNLDNIIRHLSTSETKEGHPFILSEEHEDSVISLILLCVMIINHQFVSAVEVSNSFLSSISEKYHTTILYHVLLMKRNLFKLEIAH